MSDLLRKMVSRAAGFLPHPFNAIVHRRVLGARIHPSARIGFLSVIDSRDLELASGARIGRRCFIRGKRVSLATCATVGHRVTVSVNSFEMGPRSILGDAVTVEGDSGPKSRFQMGMHSWVFRDSYVNVTREVLLERNVGIGGRSLLFTHGFWLPEIHGYPVSFAPIRIESDVWIPWSCFVTPGVRIGRGVVVGARSLVNRDVAPDALIAGIPAKVIRPQSHRPVTNTEMVAKLHEYLTSFHDSTNVHVSVQRVHGITKYVAGGTVLFAVHEGAPEESALIDGALNFLVPGSCETVRNSSKPALELRTFLSSRDALLPEHGRRFLEFARSYGFRFYPWDEAERDEAMRARFIATMSA